jgi:hypothetical protein
MFVPQTLSTYYAHDVSDTAHPASANGEAIVHCSTGERLVGGGCGGGCAAMGRSEPRDFGVDDTVGAAWVCRCNGVYMSEEGTVFALCEGLAADSG